MERNSIIPIIPTPSPKMRHNLFPLPVVAVLRLFVMREQVLISWIASNRGVWRLEVMPDAVVVNDPFAKPSLDKEVVTIAYGAWDMALQIPI